MGHRLVRLVFVGARGGGNVLKRTDMLAGRWCLFREVAMRRVLPVVLLLLVWNINRPLHSEENKKAAGHYLFA